MKNWLFPFLIVLLTASFAQAQFYKNVEIKAGPNYSRQYILSVQEEPETDFQAGWQFGLSKQWQLTEILFAETGAGLSRNGSRVLTQHQNMAGEEFNTWENVRLHYAFLEAGLNLRDRFGRFIPFVGANFRLAHKYQEDYSNFFRFMVFNSESSTDYGVNFKTGTSYSLGSFEPFLELSYFLGIHNLLSGHGFTYADSNGQYINSDNNIVRNRAVALQLGFRF